MTMDFTPTPAQLALADLTGQILRDRVGPDQLRRLEAERRSGGHRFDPQLWDVLAETGVLAAALPKAAGGEGAGLLEMCSVLIELGRALAPVPYLPTIAMAGSALARYGTAQQQTDWLKPALNGRMILTVALTEPTAGDLLAPSTRAEPTSTGWTLTGTKTTVLAGALARGFLVSAATPDGPGLFLLTPEDVGVRITRQEMVDQDDAGLLEMDDVRLPVDRLLGAPDAGVDRQCLPWVLQRATVALCAHQLGVLERALELTAQYAGTRTQFDRPIGTFQAVAQRLADAYIQVQALRLALWNAAWTLDPGSPDPDPGSADPGSPDPGSSGPDSSGPTADAVISAVAMAKFWAAEAGHHVAHTCVHIHGGAGLDVEQPIHRYFLAAKRAEFDLGGATAQLLVLGAALAGPETI
jgi:alkylation response protein AidB-like acyl-CoA dehydrogenase